MVRNRLMQASMEVLEDRRLFSGFTYWSSIQPAIAKVPQSIGPIASTSVVNNGTTVYTGPLDVTNTLNRIRADNGPDRSDDGSVYTNPQASGLAVDGTYYEFTVDPATGTNKDFTNITFPGPMRILLATGGDCYFTGDHYSTFTEIYAYGASTPTIGSFTDSPTSVTVGTPTTLTASNVNESGGTISSVKFYLESNGTSGLQTTGDTLVGTGTQSGSTWSISAPTTGFAAGTYTYYAVATDSGGTSSAASSTTLTVGAAAPTIGSFTASPASVTAGTSINLSAGSVTDTGGTISSVKFYLESNGTSGLQTSGDTLIGTGTASGSTYSISASTTGLAAGTYTYYAYASGTGGTATASTTETVTVTGGGGGTPTPQVEEAWNVTGQTAYGTQGLAASTVGTGLTNSLGLTRGSGVTTSGTAASNAWGGANWATTSAAGISGNETVTFGLTVATGYTQAMTSLDLNYRRSSSGPANGYWQYQVNGGTWALIGDYSSEFSSTSSSGAAITEISLTGITALQSLAAGSAVNFRITPYASTSTGGTWYVYDETGNDLVVNGSYTPVSGGQAKTAVATFSSTPITTTSTTDNKKTIAQEIFD